MPTGIYKHKKGVHPSLLTEFKKGHKVLQSWRKKMKEAKKGKVSLKKGKHYPHLQGENSHLWKGDKCKKRQERNDGAYVNWVNRVKKRDKNRCRINNEDCSGYCEVHHILSWSKYPELRYEVNNGITLCQYHHPKKRVDEQRLIPFFQTMVGSKEIIWKI